MVKRIMIGFAAVVLSLTFSAGYTPNAAIAAEQVPLLWSVEWMSPDLFLCHERNCDPTNPYGDCCLAG